MPDHCIDLAKNRAADLLASAEAELEAGTIDEPEWYRRIAAVITPAYLHADTPWGQSGRSGDALSWEHARSLIIDAVDRPGGFLDVGCASGYLMACLPRWSAAKGIAIEPYGLDIAPELAGLAQSRLPQWRDRIFVGNAIDWHPPRRFEYVRTGLEYVPRRRQRDLVIRLLDEFLTETGRLIIGVTNEERDKPETLELLTGWDLRVSGTGERPHRDERLMYRVVWVDRR